MIIEADDWRFGKQDFLADQTGSMTPTKKLQQWTFKMRQACLTSTNLVNILKAKETMFRSHLTGAIFSVCATNLSKKTNEYHQRRELFWPPCFRPAETITIIYLVLSLLLFTQSQWWKSFLVTVNLDFHTLTFYLSLRNLNQSNSEKYE